MKWSAEQLNSLSLAQRAALESRLLKKPARPQGTIPELAKGPQPLSFGQESLWILEQSIPGSPLYNISQAFRLRGLLHFEHLRQAFLILLERQDALRTRIVVINEVPMQEVQSARGFSIPVTDLRSSPHAEEESRTVIEQEIRKTFDLSRDLLLRARLIQLDSEEHILIVTVHHIVADHFSLGTIYRDLSLAYGALQRGAQPALPPLDVRFSQLVQAEREWVKSEADDTVEYWKKQLDQLPDPVGLPTDFRRPRAAEFKGERIECSISPHIARELQRIARDRNASMYITTLAAFSALLYRYGRQEEIVVGAPLGQRALPGADQVAGFLVNTLPFRLDVSGNPGFTQLLDRTREGVLSLFAHQRLPVEKLIHDLRLEREPGQHPFYQVVFQFLSGIPAPNLDGIAAEVLPVHNGTAKFDLTFTVADTPTGLGAEIEYNSRLFRRETIVRMVDHFRTLLDGIVLNPQEKLSRLPILTREERQQLLIDWNQTKTKYPKASTIHSLFEEQARRTPEAVALSFGGRKMTYGELNEKAGRLASLLRARGVKRGARVGICLDRSFELVIGLLAILKTGSAYVPLDANYPKERLGFMAEDSGAELILTQSGYQSLFETDTLAVDRVEWESAGQNDGIIFEDGSSEDPAYIIYTSGSTGNPKGVQVPHKAVVRLVRETNYVSISVKDVFLQFAPVSFDASTLELWGALVNGARLAIFPARFESLEQLGRIIREENVTTLWLTAGLFHEMVDHHLPALKPVRQLLAGGDVLAGPQVMKFLREPGTGQLINGYGPTENTTFTCCHPVPKNWPGNESVPIGRPISNTQVYIVDRFLNPVPIGVAGELYTGGDGLALGYLNNEQLTREKFVPNPFAPELSGRLYRTGDLARYRADGTIEFLGRVDNQVKIRGYRIELDEVEGALARLPGVEQAAVAAHLDSSNTRALVAFIVPKAGAPEVEAKLESQLGTTLPRHMVPSRFIIVEKLPLTANGKVDRKQLLLTLSEGAFSRAVEVPANPVEAQLIDIWKEVLRVEKIGRSDNFFQLGGHSLLATRVVSRINAKFNSNLSLAALFEAPTISALGQRIAPSERPEGGQIRRRNRQSVADLMTRMGENGAIAGPSPFTSVSKNE